MALRQVRSTTAKSSGYQPDILFKSLQGLGYSLVKAWKVAAILTSRLITYTYKLVLPRFIFPFPTPWTVALTYMPSILLQGTGRTSMRLKPLGEPQKFHRLHLIAFCHLRRSTDVSRIRLSATLSIPCPPHQKHFERLVALCSSFIAGSQSLCYNT